MIHEITLRNFQGHKDTWLRLSKGINVIIGSSNEGKTSIIRGIKWVKDNRPTGLATNSYWNRDKNGKPTKAQAVTLVLEDVAIDRIRGKDFNGYEIWTEESTDAGTPSETLKAIGTDVPESVTKAINMSEVNLQRQFDAPFLLNDSPADVARSFNKVVNLWKIDTILGNAELKRQRLNRELKASREEHEGIIEKAKKLSWVDKVDAKLKIAERRSERIIKKETEAVKLDSLMVKCESALDKLKEFPKDLDKIETLIMQAESLNNEIDNKFEEKNELDEMVSKLKNINRDLDPIKDIDFIKAERRISRAEKMHQDLEDKVALCANVESDTISIKRITKEIEGLDKIIKDLTAKLPDTCPLCNQPIKELT